MTLLTLLILAVALAMDAFAVAVASGVQLRCINASQTVRMAGTFGLFQFAMPVIGWFLGAGLEKLIQDYDHWVAFVLLFIVGARMLKEAWEKRGQPAEACVMTSDPTQGASLFFLGIATSVDALAVGLSFGILGHGVWFPAAVIGVVCFTITAVGLHLGKIVCSLAGNWTNRANAVGGLVLIAIGLNILREHGMFV
ncbi:putative manganese efflux pump MntP [uncultured delta proteobacterium]|uniref:Putative manganese efflux pump MntP n=1 Tax=uncultured delta proteobacterium TaxID=34034 RepID=A0A212K3P6_9DELT|nr:putative manganese efflux pump MntP [uncultured delta proteobacterium]